MMVETSCLTRSLVYLLLAFPSWEFRHQVRSRCFGTEAVSLSCPWSAREQNTDSGRAGKAHFWVGGVDLLLEAGAGWVGVRTRSTRSAGLSKLEDKPGSMPWSTAEAQNHPKGFSQMPSGHRPGRAGSLGPGRALARICDKALGVGYPQLTSSKQERQQCP